MRMVQSKALPGGSSFIFGSCRGGPVFVCELSKNLRDCRKIYPTPPGDKLWLVPYGKQECIPSFIIFANLKAAAQAIRNDWVWRKDPRPLRLSTRATEVQPAYPWSESF